MLSFGEWGTIGQTGALVTAGTTNKNEYKVRGNKNVAVKYYSQQLIMCLC